MTEQPPGDIPGPRAMTKFDLVPKLDPVPPETKVARAALDALIQAVVDAAGGGRALDGQVSAAFGLDGTRPFTTDFTCCHQAAPQQTQITMVIRGVNELPGPKYLAIAGHPALEQPIEWWHADPCCAFVIAGLMTARTLDLLPDGLFGDRK